MPEEQKKEIKAKAERAKEEKTIKTTQQKPVTAEMPKGTQPLQAQKNTNSSTPWMFATILLLILSIVLGMLLSRDLTTAKSVEKNVAAQEVAALLNNVFGIELEPESIEEKEDLYEITYKFSDREFLIFTTKDLAFIRLPNGNWIRKAELDLEETAEDNESAEKDTTTEEITIQPTVTVGKSSKPKVELFVMSLCPYTLQAEKGIIPAVDALGNKIDFTIKYMHYMLQGAKEDEENKRQICIREEQPGKFFPYLRCFLNSDKPGDCIKTSGIDAAKVESCIKNKALQYYLNDSKQSKAYNVEKSPTLMLNGKAVAFFPRDPSTARDIFCGTFTTKPAECSQELPTENPSAAFGPGVDDKNIEGFCG